MGLQRASSRPIATALSPVWGIRRSEQSDRLFGSAEDRTRVAGIGGGDQLSGSAISEQSRNSKQE
jgi:hypothetical protein